VGLCDVPQPAPGPVTHDGVADDAGHDETDEGRSIDVFSVKQVNYDVGTSGTASAPDGQRELGTPPHPMGGRQHDGRLLRRRREHGPCGAARR
jgi:hypothetical protein